jgi:hypothetical protein
MAGRVKFKSEPRRVESAQRVLEWFPRAWRAFIQWLQGLRKRRAAGVRWKVQPTGQRRGGLVLRGSQLHCPACGGELTDGAEMVRCSLDPAHVVHARCSRDLVKGKCPRDGGALEAAD